MRAEAFREASGISRRALLGAAVVAASAACTSKEPDPVRSSGPPSVPASGSRSGSPRTTLSDDPRHRARFASLERTHGARLGLYALATGTGAVLAHRAEERFAFCSTFKSLAAAAVLHRNPLSHLDRHVPVTRADVNSISPIAEKHIGSGMTIRELCDAAVRHSDGTAGNLLVRDLGGPGHFNAFLRELGDPVSRLDQYEPGLNDNRPGDPRDTTAPRALAGTHRALLLGTALPADKRALLKDWLLTTVTGAQCIRAGLPRGWTCAHKTGTGDFGRANDVAVAWPPPGKSAPIVLAIMTDRPGQEAEPKEALLAEATSYAVSVLT
ncbi:beta-lactamase [Streptomyces spiroverticillatus]|uniref:Beta-lactamase n=1 Tax=Streptomyces finlayi TaxID=67296 RepID=A0A918WWV7_9ACTN|nr:class A beta-lactamase [Streptomyces finlayi]GHA08536.1 beta-lactamase [Streptomyces spiroverticillatus]GHC91485.1 beta-lactamase [Streptomyces finlayi]